MAARTGAWSWTKTLSYWVLELPVLFSRHSSPWNLFRSLVVISVLSSSQLWSSWRTKCRYNQVYTTTSKAACTLNEILYTFCNLLALGLSLWCHQHSTWGEYELRRVIFRLRPSSANLSIAHLNMEPVLLLPHHGAHFSSLQDSSMLFAGRRRVRTLHPCVFVKTILSFSAPALSLLCLCL